MADVAGLEGYWPLFGLRVRSGPLELRVPSDEDLVALARLAASGVHPAGEQPFRVPWTARPAPELERGTLQYHWRCRAEWRPDAWRLELAVVAGGEIAGSQGVVAEDFATTRSVETGSWLGIGFQGRGIGRRMRQAVLALAFGHLGALEARSGALDGNAASAAVSAALGYRPDGTATHAVAGRRRVERRFVLDRATWAARPRPRVTVEGLEPCLPLLGVAAGDGAAP